MDENIFSFVFAELKTDTFENAFVLIGLSIDIVLQSV